MLKQFSIFIFIAYLATVSYLSLSIPSSITDIGHWDKAAHALAYLGFSFLCAAIASNRKQFLGLLILCACYGVFIEFLQSKTAYRTASLADEFANLAGLVTGCLILGIIHIKKPISALKK
jgi:VanZ family protein